MKRRKGRVSLRVEARLSGGEFAGSVIREVIAESFEINEGGEIDEVFGAEGVLLWEGGDRGGGDGDGRLTGEGIGGMSIGSHRGPPIEGKREPRWSAAAVREERTSWWGGGKSDRER